MEINMMSIGVLETPWKSLVDMPIQPLGAKSVKGKIILKSEYREGLKDLEGFSHITLIYYLHKVGEPHLKVIPFMDTVKRGVYATRSPKRPNKIGLSTVKIDKIEDGIVYISDVDMLDGTPLLDIKPFFEGFDNRFNTEKGWLKDKAEQSKETRSDHRFL